MEKCVSKFELTWASHSATAAAKSLQSCLTLCDPVEGSSPPGSPIPGILQARILEWVAISFSSVSCPLRDQTHVSCIAGVAREGLTLIIAAAKLLQSCPTLCDSTDGSPPGSLVPRILQARTLEWAAISFSNA